MNKVLKIKIYKAGYIVKDELVNGAEYGCEDFVMKIAYTLSGDYIGDPRVAYRLCKKLGIKPEKADPSDNVCSIGFSVQNQKWYGWSHRAICGFGIGSVAKEGDSCTMPGWVDEYVKEHLEAGISVPVGFVANTLEDAKRMALAFAESVS